MPSDFVDADRLPQPLSASSAPARKRSAERSASTAPSTDDGAPGPATRLFSEQLLGRASEVEIEHEGAVYRLRRTSLGKLILTK